MQNQKLLLHYTRIESNITAGVPDINICIEGREFWIECKVGSEGVNSLQVSWHIQRTLCGGLVFIIRYRDNIYFLSKLDYNSESMILQGKDLEYVITNLVTKYLNIRKRK